jgi:hypothetical protein
MSNGPVPVGSRSRSLTSKRRRGWTSGSLSVARANVGLLVNRSRCRNPNSESALATRGLPAKGGTAKWIIALSVIFATIGAQGLSVGAASARVRHHNAPHHQSVIRTCTAAPVHLPPARVGNLSGIQWVATISRGTQCTAQSNASTPKNATPPNPTYQGTPPLIFNGGSVAGTSTPGELTVTPIYWVPTGGSYSFPAGYESLLNQFNSDAAASSGQPTNVFSNVEQYTNSASAHLHYVLHAGAPVTDTNAFPTSGCTPDSGQIWSDGTSYSECITNTQLISEATSFTTAQSLPVDLAHLYVFYLPKGVESCFTSSDGAQGGQCTANANSLNAGSFCGYHTWSGSLLVSDMPYAVVDSRVVPNYIVGCSSDLQQNTGGNQTPTLRSA